MQVTVTGAAGFVGGNLIRALLDAGRRVRAVIYSEAERDRLAGLDVEMVQGDVRNLDDMIAACEGSDVVYHLAGYISLLPTDWPLLEGINIQGPRNVVEACLRTGVRRLVHFSSFHALEQAPYDRPLDESNRLVSDSCPAPYNRSKAQGEQVIREGIKRGLDAVIVSPTGIIGPNDHAPSYFGSVLLELAQGKLPFLVNGGCDWVDVRDVVAGAMAAEQHAPTGHKYLLSGQWMTLDGIAWQVAGHTGLPAPRITFPMWMARLYAPLNTLGNRLMNRTARLTTVALEELSGNPVVSHARAAAELGYRPRPLPETISDTLHWYAATGMLPRLPESNLA